MRRTILISCLAMAAVALTACESEKSVADTVGSQVIDPTPQERGIYATADPRATDEDAVVAEVELMAIPVDERVAGLETEPQIAVTLTPFDTASSDAAPIAEMQVPFRRSTDTAAVVTSLVDSACRPAAAVFFPTDSSKLGDGDRDVLARYAECLKRELADDVELRLIGRSDARGTAEYNKALSRERADAVEDVLVARGFDDEQVTLVPRGERRSELDEPSEWPLDRRVDVIAH